MNNRNRTRTTPTESNEQSNPPDDNDPIQRVFTEINTSRSLQQPSDAFIINVPKVSINPRETSQDKRTTASTIPMFDDTDLQVLGQLEPQEQIRYLLNQRTKLEQQLNILSAQFHKEFSMVKRRLEESESNRERLTHQYQTASKELILYKNLVEAPDNPDPSVKTRDYQQLKLIIADVLKENERLNNELQNFKTTDPVYEQVQLLEQANQQLKQDLKQANIELAHLRTIHNPDETKQLKLQLAKILNEYEQLKSIHQKLVHQLQQQQTSSPKQIRVYPSSPAPIPRSQHQQPSPISQRSSRSSPAAFSPPHFSTEIVQLREHVQHLEKTLHKRDNELQKLQNEIEKGTNSIMSSIEDLYIVSTNVTPANRLPIRTAPTVDDLQNELDQLHDKLDELTRENQFLKTRTQEFDTIYEENEYLYAEKSRWNEEIERARVRQLVLEQEIQTLKEREKELINANESSLTNPNNSASSTSPLKLKIDLLKKTNNQLELEVVQLKEQIEHVTEKYEELKQEYLAKHEHYRRLFTAAENNQQIPQELARIEKLNIELENQFESDRQEYEKIIAALEEMGQQREQKYGSLYDTISKLQNDYRQREMEFMHQMDEIVKQRDQLQNQFSTVQKQQKELEDENLALKEEIKSNSNINRDLKSALTSTNNDAHTIHNQLKQLKAALNQLQEKYDKDLAERNAQIEKLRAENKQTVTNYDNELIKNRQTIIQLQHDNNQYLNQLEKYRSNVGKLQVEIGEKRNFLEQVQNDNTERSSVQLNINNQLVQDNKMKTTKLIELEQTIAQEQQRRTEMQRTIQELQMELLKSRSIARESAERSEEYERRCQETDKHFLHLNEATEPARRELHQLRAELVTKSDQITMLHHTIEDEKLKRQRLEMKLKRLKDEYINVRKELYIRVEENNTLQHELVASRLKNDYYTQLTNQNLDSMRSAVPNDNDSNTAVQLYLKEKAENQHCQLKCRTYQQKLEQLQKSYEVLKEKYKERLQEERDVFERNKKKYLEHIKNVQRDLHETRRLLEKDAELKMNQETAYQQLIEERRQLLTNMVEKDAKVREMRRENLLLLSKIQLLENQMEGLNERVDRTLRERNQLRREINTVRLDTNVSIEVTSARASPNLISAKPNGNIDSTGWSQTVFHAESFGFTDGNRLDSTPINS